MTTKILVGLTQYPVDFFKDFDEWKRKTEAWVAKIPAATDETPHFILFPEYGSMELTSLFEEAARHDLKSQAHSLLPYVSRFIEHFQTLAKKYNIYILAPSLPVYHDQKLTTNRTFVFTPNGQVEHQDKIFMTRFEDEHWNVQAGEPVIKVFQIKDFSFAICTCFDVEFAPPAMAAAQVGAQVLFVPSCTETIKGMNRVHIGARARALENQCYTVISQVVGEAKWSPAVDINVGMAAIYAPPDTGFTDDGVLLQGPLNQADLFCYELDLHLIENVRKNAAVFNFKKHGDWIKSAGFKIFHVEEVKLD